MKVAYIAGPYRADTVAGIVQNIRRAEEVAIKYWKLGYAVICPHKNTALFDGLLPDAFWLTGDMEFIRRLEPGNDILVAIEGWEDSTGTRAEIELAEALRIEIVYDD